MSQEVKRLWAEAIHSPSYGAGLRIWGVLNRLRCMRSRLEGDDFISCVCVCARARACACALMRLCVHVRARACVCVRAGALVFVCACACMCTRVFMGLENL